MSTGNLQQPQPQPQQEQQLNQGVELMFDVGDEERATEPPPRILRSFRHHSKDKSVDQHKTVNRLDIHYSLERSLKYVVQNLVFE